MIKPRRGAMYAMHDGRIIMVKELLSNGDIIAVVMDSEQRRIRFYPDWFQEAVKQPVESAS